MACILIIEDDRAIALGLKLNLRKDGHEVRIAADGETGLRMALEPGVDLVVLDVMLPMRNGYEVLKELRRRGSTVAILMLTAKGMEGDKILGLKLGADDYLAKPFGLGELLARVEALLRRRPPAAPDGHKMRFGTVEVDLESPDGPPRGQAGRGQPAGVQGAAPLPHLGRPGALARGHPCALLGGGVRGHAAHGGQLRPLAARQAGGERGGPAPFPHRARARLPVRTRMKFIHTALPGVIVVEPDVHRDARGFFLETFHARKYREGGIDCAFVQTNQSRSTRGTLRGLHAQRTKPQAKLVRAVRGEIFDVAVDIRTGRHVGVVLSEDNFRQLFVPAGCLHGFCVVSEVAEIEYACSELYNRDDEIGALWSSAGIPWPIAEPLLSPKDAALPPLAELRKLLER